MNFSDNFHPSCTQRKDSYPPGSDARFHAKYSSSGEAEIRGRGKGSSNQHTRKYFTVSFCTFVSIFLRCVQLIGLTEDWSRGFQAGNIYTSEDVVCMFLTAL